MGGEKDIAPVSPIGVSGSPPRGRGKGFTKSFEEHGFGITPAWAGKRVTTSASTSVTEDHPRMGGEKLQ